jgi:hypothetical protein
VATAVLFFASAGPALVFVVPLLPVIGAVIGFESSMPSSERAEPRDAAHAPKLTIRF